MIHIFIVEDSRFLREVMGSELSRQEDFTLAGSVPSSEEAVLTLKQKKQFPDVIIMDITLPGKDGIECTREIRTFHPDAKVVVLTSSQSREDLFKALDAGAVGFVSKDSPRARLFEAIRLAHEGHALIDPAFTFSLIQEFVQFRKNRAADLPAVDDGKIQGLTVREIEILYLVGQGKSNAEIGGELSVAEVTVKSHIHQLLRKLSMSNRMQLAIFAYDLGLREGKPAPSKGGLGSRKNHSGDE